MSGLIPTKFFRWQYRAELLPFYVGAKPPTRLCARSPSFRERRRAARIHRYPRAGDTPATPPVLGTKKSCRALTLQPFGFDNPKMHEYMTNRLIFLLPSPVIKILGLQVNKFDNKYSPGDLLSTEALGLRQQYMGFRVAGDTGIGLYLWGYKYYIFAFFLYYALFYFLSSKVLVKQDGSVIIPIVELIAVWGVFLTFNNSTGIVRVISTLLRLGWQTIFVYCLVFFVVRKFIR